MVNASTEILSAHTSVSPRHRREISVVIPKQKEMKAKGFLSPRNPPRMHKLPVIPPLRSHDTSSESIPFLKSQKKADAAPDPESPSTLDAVSAVVAFLQVLSPQSFHL